MYARVSACVCPEMAHQFLMCVQKFSHACAGFFSSSAVCCARARKKANRNGQAGTQAGASVQSILVKPICVIASVCGAYLHAKSDIAHGVPYTIYFKATHASLSMAFGALCRCCICWSHRTQRRATKRRIKLLFLVYSIHTCYIYTTQHIRHFDNNFICKRHTETKTNRMEPTRPRKRR